MGFDEHQMAYLPILTPLSICGIVLNALLLWMWYTERYKFSRLILKTIAGVYITFLTIYHVWHYMLDRVSGYEIAAVILYTIRLYLATLYTFLAAMQYLYSADLIHYHAHPLLVQRNRIIVGLVLVGLYCVSVRFLKIFMDSRIHRVEQKVVLSAIFRGFMYFGPQMTSLYFVVRMFFNIRHHQRLIQKEGLESVISRYCLKESGATKGPGGFGPNAMWKTKLRSVATQFISRMSVASNPPDGKLSIKPKLLSSNVYKQLKNNMKLELHVTKAIMLLALPTIFIYTFGFTGEIIVKQIDNNYLDLFYVVLDILQFINASYCPLLLIIMLPSFRHLVQRRMTLLLTGRRVETRMFMHQASIKPTGSTTSGSTGSDSSTPSESEYIISPHASQPKSASEMSTSSTAVEPGAQLKRSKTT